MSDANHELIVLHRSFPSQIWTDVSSYITGGTPPKALDNENSTQFKFEISLQDKSFTDILNLKTGDDICIPLSRDYNSILDNKYCGKIHKRNVKINVFGKLDGNNKCKNIQTQVLTVQQRDFSLNYIELSYSSPLLASVVLTSAFSSYTRQDLGGFLSTKNKIIEKFIILPGTVDQELPSFEFKGTPLQILKEICKRLLWDFKIVSFSEPHNTNLINTMYQVQIWQM